MEAKIKRSPLIGCKKLIGGLLSFWGKEIDMTFREIGLSKAKNLGYFVLLRAINLP